MTSWRRQQDFQPDDVNEGEHDEALAISFQSQANGHGRPTDMGHVWLPDVEEGPAGHIEAKWFEGIPIQIFPNIV